MTRFREFGVGAFGGTNYFQFHDRTIISRLKEIGGLTFYKDYSDLGLNANYSVGSLTGTLTSARDATHPATYIDKNGVIQTTTTADVGRFDYGYYDATGYHAFTLPKLHIEGARTNEVIQGIHASAWTLEDSFAGTPTTALVAETLTSIAASKAQTFVYTASVGESGGYGSLYSDFTAVGSVAQDDVVTISGYIRGTVTGTAAIKLTMKVYDDVGGGGETLEGSNMASSIHATEWRRFSATLTITDADASKIRMKFPTFAGVDEGDAFSLEVACCQLEVSSYATSFIPTVAAGLGRTAEVLKYVISGNRTAATEGCVVNLIPEYASTISAANNYIIDSDTKARAVYLNAASNDVYVYPNITDTVG